MLAQLAVERGPRVGSTFVVRPGAAFVVGSDPSAQGRLEGLQPKHAAFVLDGAGLRVVDLVGGVTLDGTPLVVRQPTPAGTGQAVALGGVVLRIELDGAPEPARGASGRSPAASGAARPILSPPLDGYELLAELGKGGMGTVLRARRLADRREVALKLLHDSPVPGSPDHRRWEREVRVGQRIRSRHVAELLDAFVDRHGRAVIVLELVPGRALQADLAGGRTLPLAEALRAAEQVALGLAAAHEAGVVHRDVKPANILRTPDGTAKLVDFGVAKDLRFVESVTRSGVGLGTLVYMAPEQLEGAKQVEPQADVYGLGATLYHMLCGRVPIVVKQSRDLLKLIEEPPAPPRQLRPDCPPALEELVLAMLAKRPQDRPPSALDVAGRLRWLAGQR